jgi:hypothetical protein
MCYGISPSPFAFCCPVPFVLPDFFVVFTSMCACFSWDSSYDLMLMVWLYVDLHMCDVFSCSFLPISCPDVENVLPA